MRALRRCCIVLLSGVMLACGTAPVKVSSLDQCYGCRRYVRNVRLASEIISGEGSLVVSKFRGPGCMARYLADHPEENGTIFVTDYTSGKMFRPAKAYFVAEVVDRNTGEFEYRTYRDEAEAGAAASLLQTSVMGWQEVLDKAH